VSFDVLDGATDPDGDPLTVTNVGQPAHGTASCTADGHCTYTPDAGYTGPDSFTYEISDGGGSAAGQAEAGRADVASAPSARPPAPC